MDFDGKVGCYERGTLAFLALLAIAVRESPPVGGRVNGVRGDE